MKKVIGYVTVKREHMDYPYHNFFMENFSNVMCSKKWKGI